MNHFKIRIAAIAVAGALVVPIAGCGSSSSSGGTTTSAAAGVAEAQSWATSTPAATGSLQTVTWDLPYGEPTTLDYLQSAAPSENTVLSSLCEGLLRTRPDLTTEPALAEKVEHPNPLTYIYQLRPGVKFTDGKPLTAADAVFSLHRNQIASLGSFWETWFTNVKSIVATGPLTVKVSLSKPDGLFNPFMATAAGTIVEQAYAESKGAKYGSAQGGVMCTGPFKLANWTPSKSITIERNPNYWDTAHTAKTQKIVFDFITNSAAINAALTSGEIDGTYEAPLSTSTSSAGKVYLGKSTQFVSINFTERKGPVQELQIREALSLALERPAIAKKIFKNSAIPIFSPFTPATWSYEQATFAQQTAELPNPAVTDLAKAKELVKEVAPVRPLDLLVSADDASQRQLATYLAATAQTVGIPIKIDQLPAKQAVAAANEPKLLNQYDMAMGTGYVDVADPLVQAVWQLLPGGPFNNNGYSNPTVTHLIEAARATNDLKLRASLLGKIGQQAYGKDYSTFEIVNLAERLFLGKRVTGVPASLPSYLYFPWSRDLGASGGTP